MFTIHNYNWGSTGEYYKNCLHIFGDCIFSISVWQKCCSLLNIKLLNWDGDLNSELKCWIRYRKDYAALPIFCWWSIWRAQNLCIFEGEMPMVDKVVGHILITYSMQLIPKMMSNRLHCIVHSMLN